MGNAFICEQAQPAATQSADDAQSNTDKLQEVIIQNYQARKPSNWRSRLEADFQNYIHVSVRKAVDEHGPVDDADYEYSDPSPFLDRLVPTPQWIQECNDFEFR